MKLERPNIAPIVFAIVLVVLDTAWKIKTAHDQNEIDRVAQRWAEFRQAPITAKGTER